MTAGMERRAEAIAAKAFIADRNRTDRRRAADERNPILTAEKAITAIVGDAWRISSDGRRVFGLEQGSPRAFGLFRVGRRFELEVSPDARCWDDAPIRLTATDPEGIANEVAAILQHNDGLATEELR